MAVASMLCVLTANAQSKETEEDYNSLLSVRTLFNGTTEPQHFDNHFTVTPPEGYLFVDAENSKKFLVDFLGNPNTSMNGVIGCIIPDVNDIYTDSIPHYFVLGDDMCGYINDDDASSLDYNELMLQMQEDTKTKNAEYRKSHPDFPVVTLVGWAEQPYYNNSTHTLHWCEVIEFGGERTINYDMRFLGKDGYVMLKAVGDVEDLDALKDAGREMLGNIIFDEGYAYADFDEGSDHIAEWTIGGLIAGKALAKAGFWALVVKSWKLILLAVVAGFGVIKAFFSKFFRRKKDNEYNE